MHLELLCGKMANNNKAYFPAFQYYIMLPIFSDLYQYIMNDKVLLLADKCCQCMGTRVDSEMCMCFG